MADIFSNKVVEFRSHENYVTLSVRLDAKKETVWLSLNQIAELFQRDKSVISRHLKKAFERGELDKEEVVAKNATTALDKKTYIVEFFNLDAILAVGYRVNSQKGIEFRQWATRVLKDHLLKGLSINKERLLILGLCELDRSSLDLLRQSLLNQNIDINSAALDIIRSYAKSWLLLNAFDKNFLQYPQGHQDRTIQLSEKAAVQAIKQLKLNLLDKNEATHLFGIERQDTFKQIMGSIHQTFNGEMLYPSAYERAAHLFYFTIKDHPFVDGNKRIGSLLLLLYLSSHEIGFLLSNEALVSLALFVAQSSPYDKESVIKLILNLIVRDETG